MHTRPLLAAAALLAGAACAAARDRPPPPPAAPDTAPAALALPAGEARAFALRARGTQNYECRESADAPGTWAWALVAPLADLFDEADRRVGRHYAGPTWESTADGSKVVGEVTARADAPEPDAIPWLLLKVTEAGGQGLFAGVKSVRRVDTHGGKPPASACAADRAGYLARVPYSATYEFARAAPR